MVLRLSVLREGLREAAYAAAYHKQQLTAKKEGPDAFLRELFRYQKLAPELVPTSESNGITPEEFINIIESAGQVDSGVDGVLFLVRE